MVKLNVEISCFPGFYDGSLFGGDNIYYEKQDYIDSIKERFPDFDVSEDDCEFDYDGYEKTIGEKFAAAYGDLYPKDIVKSVSFETIIPPRDTGYGPDYKTGTDRLFVDIEVCDDWADRLFKFIDKNLTWFSWRIEKDWTSYDGFASNMSTDVDEWKQKILDVDFRYIGQTLDYIVMRSEDKTCSELSGEISEEVWEDSSMCEYISLNEEKDKEYNKLLESEKQ